MLTKVWAKNVLCRRKELVRFCVRGTLFTLHLCHTRSLRAGAEGSSFNPCKKEQYSEGRITSIKRTSRGYFFLRASDLKKTFTRRRPVSGAKC
jgi:hypothetical protein